MVDKFQLLEFLVNREERNPGGSLQGSTLLMDAPSLEPERSLAYNNLTRAVAELKRLGWIEWVYRSWSKGPVEPPAHLITQQDLQNVGEIIVSNAGHERLAERRSQAARMQINIVNSPYGLCLRDDSRGVPSNKAIRQHHTNKHRRQVGPLQAIAPGRR